MSMMTRLCKAIPQVWYFILLWLAPFTVHALNCSATIGNVNFGGVNVLSVANPLATQTAPITVECTTAILEAGGNVTACIWLGGGSGGYDTSSRFLSGSMRYDLYKDSAYSQIWGWTGAPLGNGPESFVFNVSDGLLGIGGYGSTSGTLYAAVSPNQSTLSVGSYSSSFSTPSQSLLKWARGTNVSCSSMSNTDPINSFSVTASIAANCLIATNDLNFGTTSSLASNVDASTTLSVTCTNATSYSVGLSNGDHYSSGRRMRLGSSGNNYINYELYTDLGHKNVWSNSCTTLPGSSANCANGTGTGSSQQPPITVYGQVPAQSITAAGTYTDTIIATITF